MVPKPESFLKMFVLSHVTLLILLTKLTIYFGTEKIYTQEAREALYEREDIEPLFELLRITSMKLTSNMPSLRNATKKANQSCLAAAENCKQRRQEAKSKKMKTRIIGGTLSGGGLAGGVAIGVTATVVGVLTGGIGVRSWSSGRHRYSGSGSSCNNRWPCIFIWPSAEIVC